MDNKIKRKKRGYPVLNEDTGKMLKKMAYVTASLMFLSFLTTAITTLIIDGGVGLFINKYQYILAVFIVVFCMYLTFYGYILYQSKFKLNNAKSLVVLYSVMFVSIVTAISSMRYVSVYAVPIAMSAVMVGILVNKTTGFTTGIFVAIISLALFITVSYIDGRTVPIGAIVGVIIAILQSYSMMYLIRGSYTRFKLLWGAFAIGFIFAPIASLFASIYTSSIKEIALAGVWCFTGNAIAVGVFTVIIPIYESVFKVWTNFKLAEACSMSRPLLQRLSSEASGTFNHSIIVSNLSESCALAIGENPYLAKASGIYHDVGKLNNPEYFVENQAGGYNPHDDLIPEASVNMIISHTRVGYDLLKTNHLPEEIAKVALEHHGTSPVMYFYNKAKKITEGTLDRATFEYFGPKPSTKISAIVMISDMVEAATRAITPETKEELENLINGLINQKISEDQFADCDITFSDLTTIKNTIIKVIPSIYHKRIKYKD